VGAVISLENADKLKGDHDAVMQRFINACPMVKDLLEDATRVRDGQYGKFRIRKDYSYTNHSFWRPGLVLIGDSACFIDPVFSTGVHLATYSALLAARSINSCLRDDLDETRCFTEFERRYRAEYENLYNFLVAFYDFHQDEESYFWRARKVMSSDTPSTVVLEGENEKEAFIRLVAGGSTLDETFFANMKEISEKLKAYGEENSDENLIELKSNERLSDHFSTMSHIRQVAVKKDKRPLEAPRYEGGLVSSRDGFHWALHDPNVMSDGPSMEEEDSTQGRAYRLKKHVLKEPG
jgi:halogenation protein CepH